MPYSYVLLPGDGVTTNFNFNFGYLAKAHIHASVDTVDTSFTWITDFSIQITPAPASGTVIEIRRRTPLDEPIVDWTDGTVLTEGDMDLNTLFALYAAQEAQDGVDASVSQNSEGVFDGQGRSTTNFADPTDETGLVTKHYFDSVYTPQLDAKVTEVTTQASNAASSASQAQGYAIAADNSADLAAALLAVFKGQYLGPLSADPTLDGNGLPVSTGDLYFNTTQNMMKVYSGANWLNAGATVEGTINKSDTPVIATDGQTVVPIPGDYDAGYILVFVNGTQISPPDVDDSSGTGVVFANPLSAGDEVSWVAFGAFDVANMYSKGELNDSTGASLVGFKQPQAGAVGRTLEGKGRDVISVLDFGVVGDGIVDDTLSLQNALNATQNGILLFEPGANYNVTGTLYPKIGTTIIGNGATITNSISTAGNVFQITESNVSIDNITINNTVLNPEYTIANPSYVGADIFINSISSQVKNVSLRNITINGSITYAAAIVGIGDCENIIIDNCSVYGGKFVSCFEFEWNYRGGTSPANIIAPKNITLTNCTASGNNQLPGTLYNGGFWFSACSRVSLVNCRAYNCKNGFYIHTGDTGQQLGHKIASIMENCQAVNIDYLAIQTFFSDVISPPSNEVQLIIRNCYIFGAVESRDGCFGIQVNSTRGPLLIENNIFQNVHRGVFMGSVDTQDVSNVRVVGNKFVDIYQSAITGYGITDCVVAENKFYNVNEGSTASVVDSAIYLAYKSDRNIIKDNLFGLGNGKSRHYITLNPGGAPLKIPTNNIITNNVFVLDTIGGSNIVNNTSSETGLCKNVIEANNQANSDVAVSGAEVARLDVKYGNGSFGTSTSNARLTVKSATATSDSSAAVITNGVVDLFSVRGDGLMYTGTGGTSPYNNSSAATANLIVTSSGELQRSTSSLKYKKDVQDSVHGLSDVLRLRPVTYKGKAVSDGDKVFGGLIAEEVDAIGLNEFVQYSDDGSPDALNYGNMVSLAFKAIQEQQDIISGLKERIDTLESK